MCDDEDQKRVAAELGVAGVLHRDEDYSPFRKGYKALPLVWFTHEVVQKILDYLGYKYFKFKLTKV